MEFFKLNLFPDKRSLKSGINYQKKKSTDINYPDFKSFDTFIS